MPFAPHLAQDPWEGQAPDANALESRISFYFAGIIPSDRLNLRRVKGFGAYELQLSSGDPFLALQGSWRKLRW